MNRRLIFSLISFLVFATSSFASDKNDNTEGLRIGIDVGPSLPSTALVDVYDALGESSMVNAYELATSLGYHVGARGRAGLDDAVSLSFGVAYHRFPSFTLNLTDSTGRRLSFATATNIVPINVGLALRAPISLFEPYIQGDVLIVHHSTTISEGDKSILLNLVDPGVEVEPAYTRFGAQLSAGIGMNIAGMQPFVEFRYAWTNLVGRPDGEQQKAYASISVGLFF